jgi:polyisoprenoid-binding protein YceI
MLAATGSLLMAAVIGAGATYAQDAPAPTESAPAPTESMPADTSAAQSIDGTWQLTTEIGDFEDFSSSWVGFRVAEVLSNIGEAEAVGRTPLVSGELVINGTTIDSATIEADLTGIRSDQSRRDPAIQRALETGNFPTATFTSSAPVDLGSPQGSGPHSGAMLLALPRSGLYGTLVPPL